jgi:enoyl-CoA hydratase/carnithine racemase
MRELPLRFQPPVARLRLDRPERRNAMSLAMWRALPDICASIEARSDALVVVVEGAGGNFCAGADVSEFDEVFRDAAAARSYLDAIEAALNALIALDRPVVAAIQGAAVGGGLALALCCDLRFAAEDAHLAIPPAKLGLVYGPVETRALVELIGPARAKDLLFSGRRVETAEALLLGLIDRRLPASELDAAVDAYALELASNSQTSIRGAKRAMAALTKGDEAAARALVQAAALGDHFSEARTALAGKRKPLFR